MGDNVFTRLLKFLRGYVTVTVEGFFLEKFTNLCAINSIPFWYVKRNGTAKLTGRTTPQGFKRMRRQAKKCGCRIKIDKRRGVPFLIFRYRKRKAFVIGIVVFFAIIKIITSFVWQIEISGNEKNIGGEIVAQIIELGVPIGTLKSKVDNVKLANEIMIGRDDLSWVGVEIDGVKLKVRVIEKVKVPKMIPKDQPCDIVAKKPGVIKEMITMDGTAMVKVGEVVDKGQVLVSGIIEMIKFPERTQRVHALADVKARVWYEKSKTLKLLPNREPSQLEGFAYNIAYDKIIKEIPSDAEIVDIKSYTTFGASFVKVNVVIETLEDITEKVEIGQAT